MLCTEGLAAATIIGPATEAEGKIDRTAAAASVLLLLVLRPRYVLLNYVVAAAAAAVNTQRQSRELGREPHGTGRKRGRREQAGQKGELACFMGTSIYPVCSLLPNDV